MSLPASTFTTTAAKGNREDLSNVIYRVDPTDTYFVSSVDKVKATAVSHDWQTQALATASTANAVLEGEDAVTDFLRLPALDVDIDERRHFLGRGNSAVRIKI